ncbi:MAG: AAA family ATPase [Hyphomicrobiaceae bacterium]|nr:AAA family ATPase [Hyphomicrobiaceae bacterium]
MSATGHAANMPARSFRFASFTLDLDRLSLRTPAGEVKLRPKNFEVLRYLVENPQRVVTKEEVIATVWVGVTVGDESLTRCISDVRRALGDESQKIVKTVPKRGYLFDVPVERDAAPASPAQAPFNNGSAAPEPQVPADAPAPALVALRPARPELRPLTVLVCHIAGLKALAATLEPEDLHKVMGVCGSCIGQILESHGGFVTQHLGEGLEACFGYPRAHEDDAERAVRAGLAATRAIAELRSGRITQALQACIGIATGPVLIDDAGGNARPPVHGLIGQTPLLAAHLASLADPGTVVMSQATRRIVGGLFACRDLSADRNGSAHRSDAALVLYEDEVPSRFEALRGTDASPLVGREEELDLLLRRWEQAKAGNGRFALLTGDGGIGKSRIALTLQERLAGQYIPLIYNCSPYHQNTALHPIITQLTRSAGIRRHDSPEVRLRKLEGLLDSFGTWRSEEVALLAALMAIPGGDRYPLPDLDPEQLRERTLEVLWVGIRRLCAIRPVLAVFEDLHWIDPTSLAQLSRMVEEIPGLPLLLVGTARPEFTPPWPNYWHTSTLALTGLSPPQVKALIGCLTNGRALPSEVVDEIVARTDGVPLYVEEVTKFVLESGMVREVGDHYELTGRLPPRAVPATLSASLIARLDRLPAVKDIAQVAGAIGGDFTYSVIASVSGLPEPELKAGLAQLVAAELIFQRGVPPDASYRFKHTLVRDAAYNSLVSKRRQALHGKIARTLEEQFPALAAAMPATLAHHHAEAGALARAAAYLAKAGRQSLDRSAIAEAIAHLQRALDLLSSVPDTVEHKRQVIDARLMLFQAYLTRGEIERMTETLVAAVEVAKAIGDERRLAFATAQLALAQWMRGEHVAAAGSARFVLAYAERTEKLDPARRAETLPLQVFGKYALANALHGQGRLKEAIALHREIIGALGRLGLEGKRLGWAGFPSVMARAFLGWFLIEAGDFEAAREEIERGRALAEAAQQSYAHVLILAGDGLYHLLRGYPELAVPILDATLKMCQRVASMEAAVAGWLGTALVQVGRANEALGITEGLFRRGAHLAAGKYTWFYLFKAIGEGHAALGRADEALAWAGKAIAVTEEAQEVLHRAQGLKARGDMQLALSLPVEAAVHDLKNARQLAEQYGLKPLAAECTLSLARAAQRTGRREEARQLASLAAARFRALGLDRHLAEAEGLTR